MANKNIKYWENEDAVITSTENVELRYFAEAGKLQMYPKYSSDGSDVKDCIGKGCVWTTSDIGGSEAIEVLIAMANALATTDPKNPADVVTYAPLFVQSLETIFGGGSESDSDADPVVLELKKFEAGEIKEYADLSQATLVRMCHDVGVKASKRDSKADLVAKMEAWDTGNAEVVGYESMTVEQLRSECKNRGLKVSSRTKTAKMVEMLEQYDLEHIEESGDSMDEVSESELDAVLDAEFADDESDAQPEPEADLSYAGKYLTFDPESMEIGTVLKECRTKAYREAAQMVSDANSWIEVELADIIKNSVTKSGKNKGRLNRAKFDTAVAEWVKSFEADEAVTEMLDLFVSHYVNTALDGRKIADADLVAEHYFLTAELKREFVVAVDAYFAA